MRNDYVVCYNRFQLSTSPRVVKSGFILFLVFAIIAEISHYVNLDKIDLRQFFIPIGESNAVKPPPPAIL